MGLSEQASANLRLKMRETHEAAAHAAAAAAPPTKEEVEKQKKLTELLAANVLVQSSSLGGPTKTATDKNAPKPFVRHICVNDLRRVAKNANVTLPESNLFAERSSIALFALFDGQCSANVQSPGSFAAEWCCRNIHTKLLQHMSSLMPSQTNEMGVTSMLRNIFAELNQELLSDQVGILDGCGASLALLISDRLFTAAIGNCGILLCSPSSQQADASQRHGSKTLGVQTLRATSETTASASCIVGASSSLTVRSLGESPGHSSGQVTAPARSLGDRAWKTMQGALLQIAPPTCSSFRLSYEHGCTTLLLTSSPIAASLPSQTVKDIVVEMEQRPRAISGDIAAKARELAISGEEAGVSVDSYPCQHSAVTISFLPPRPIPEELRPLAPKSVSARVTPSPPPSKKQKTETSKGETNSVRLRHILVKHAECHAPFDPVRQKAVTRHISEAETMLRRALRELLQEQALRKPSLDAKKAALAHLQPTPKCMSLTRELSECETAKKAGMVCGDLEWMNLDRIRATFGAAFADAAKSSAVGQWSDLIASDLGLHLTQRIA